MTSFIDSSHFHVGAAPFAAKVICFSPTHGQRWMKMQQLQGSPIADDVRAQLDVIETHIWSLHAQVPAMEALV